jgi:hypothetical protein
MNPMLDIDDRRVIPDSNTFVSVQRAHRSYSVEHCGAGG